ncbi:MAG: NUDIX hydrolase, partial [Cyanobacteria bacterium J06649_4]
YGALTVPVSDLELREGQDLALCSPAEIRAGKKFSQKLGEARALGGHHRQTLLSFLESGLASTTVAT